VRTSGRWGCYVRVAYAAIQTDAVAIDDAEGEQRAT
jgi:hypothetical protein